jgi:hypothetical protein
MIAAPKRPDRVGYARIQEVDECTFEPDDRACLAELGLMARNESPVAETKHTRRRHSNAGWILP